MSTITFEYREVDYLPDDWTRPQAWPCPGVYRIMNSWGAKDLYFVSKYAVEVAFDAFEIGEIEGQITNEVAAMAENCIMKAMEKTR